MIIRMVNDFEETFWGKKLDRDNEIKLKNLLYLKKKLLAYLVASRLVNILNLSAFLLLGMWYAVGYFPVRSTILMIFFLIMFQFVHLTNMVFDKKLDIFARKNTIWIFKYLSPKEMLIVSGMCFFLGLFILWFINIAVFIAGAVLLIINILYDTPPIRFKTKPPLDSISNMLELGTLPFLVGWLSTNAQFNMDALIYGLILGLSVITYYLIASWQDIKTDTEFGIKTTCTLLGYDWTINIGLFMWILLIFSSFFVFYVDIITISFVIVFPVLTYMFIKYKKQTEYKNREKNLNFFLAISDTIWTCFIYLSLIYVSKSVIPLIFFILSLTFSLKMCIAFFLRRT